jgi:hypothetical protein
LLDKKKNDKVGRFRHGSIDGINETLLAPAFDFKGIVSGDFFSPYFSPYRLHAKRLRIMFWFLNFALLNYFCFIFGSLPESRSQLRSPVEEAPEGWHIKATLTRKRVPKKHVDDAHGLKYKSHFKGIVSRDWKGLQMVSFDRFEV